MPTASRCPCNRLTELPLPPPLSRSWTRPCEPQSAADRRRSRHSPPCLCRLEPPLTSQADGQSPGDEQSAFGGGAGVGDRERAVRSGVVASV